MSTLRRCLSVDSWTTGVSVPGVAVVSSGGCRSLLNFVILSSLFAESNDDHNLRLAHLKLWEPKRQCPFRGVERHPSGGVGDVCRPFCVPLYGPPVRNVVQIRGSGTVCEACSWVGLGLGCWKATFGRLFPWGLLVNVLREKCRVRTLGLLTCGCSPG